MSAHNGLPDWRSKSARHPLTSCGEKTWKEMKTRGACARGNGEVMAAAIHTPGGGTSAFDERWLIPEPADQSWLPMMKKRKCVILVVEDEAITLLDAEATIREAGFDVAVAANADEAIRILESRDDVCLVFSDIDMPRGSIDGVGLAQLVGKRWPAVRVILTSGQERHTGSALAEGHRFFPKPYRGSDVALAVREMTAGM
jgi:two-component system, response regulator PdtaR